VVQSGDENPQTVKNRIEVQHDGSLRGLGDSPIKIRDSYEESIEDEICDTPTSPGNEAPQGVIEESEDEKQSMIVDHEQPHDEDEQWDTSSGGFDTDEEQLHVEVDEKKSMIIEEDGSVKGIGLSPITLHGEVDTEADSEVAEVFKEDEDICKSYKEDITKSVKEILPSPEDGQGSQEEEQKPQAQEQELKVEEENVVEDIDEVQDFVEEKSIEQNIGHSEV
jgi:hypothetical protein